MGKNAQVRRAARAAHTVPGNAPNVSADTPPPRAAFTLSLSWDPNTQPHPSAHLAEVGTGGAIHQDDVLRALQWARDEFVKAIALDRAQADMNALQNEMAQLRAQVEELQKAGA